MPSPLDVFPRRVLILHNRYRYRGGEDTAVEDLARLLEEHGHQARVTLADNRDTLSRGAPATLGALFRAPWSWDAYRRVRALCREFGPHIVHVHNFWFTFTPAVLRAARDEGAAVVLSLHNFRLLCAGAVLLRDGRPCTECVGQAPWRGVWHRCYRGSAGASLAVARMAHRSRRPGGVLDRDVDRFLAPSPWARAMFARGGFPEPRLGVLSNWTEDPGPTASTATSPTTTASGPRFVFLGRLSEEKGAGTLLEAWRAARMPAGARLHLAGDGPLAAELRRRGEPLGAVFHGALPRAKACDLLAGDAVLVVPSRCHETFGLAVIEAHARGTPVISTPMGALSDLVADGVTGAVFPPGDAGALARLLEKLASDSSLRERLGKAGRARFLERYTPDAAYPVLREHYRLAMDRALFFRTHGVCRARC